MEEVADVVKCYSGHSRTVLEYSLAMKRMVDVAAKEPGFDAVTWEPLAGRVAVDMFERVGNFLEVMDWPTYAGFLGRWAATADWECSLKRIDEAGSRVWLELEERSRHAGGPQGRTNSLTVYDFDGDGRIRHIDIYLQTKPIPAEALASYAGMLKA